MSTTPEQLFGNYEKKIAELGLNLRVFLLEKLANCTETVDVSANILAFGYGNTYKENICSIIPSKKGIKLGFNRGSELPDPEKLLTGSGKLHKYVEIHSAETITNKHLLNLLNEAYLAYKKRMNNESK